MTTITGAIRPYGVDARSARSRRRRRRRDRWSVVSAAAAMVLVSCTGYDWFSTDSMLSPADAAACLIESFPVRICRSMLRRMFPFSTSTQRFAVGTNQLRAAARSFTLVPSRFVAFGILPFACRARSDEVSVNALIQSIASDLLSLVAGIARSEPPRKPGIGWPFVWLGITNCAVADLYLPVQQLNQPGPTIAAAWPCA